MPVLLLILLVSVFAYLWLARRGKTLTRSCRWRLDRTLGPSHHRCAACGAVTDAVPRHCLRTD
jgi:LSD1 subclass zinc finger protein